MILSTKLLALIACLALAVVVFELVRKKRIREEYSILWLGVTVASAVLILFDRVTLRLIKLAGGVNLASFFFFGGLVFSVVMLLNLTVRISEIKRKQNVLLQEAGLMREHIERLEREMVQIRGGSGKGPQ
jgi:hypothetical protein